jgi:hypothetical protein
MPDQSFSIFSAVIITNYNAVIACDVQAEKKSNLRADRAGRWQIYLGDIAFLHGLGL